MPIENMKTFAEEWQWLKSQYGNCEYEFEFRSQRNFGAVVKDHFGKKKDDAIKGVYIVFQLGSNDAIYIGKSGTLDRNGQYAKQGIKGRLSNTRGMKNANQEFTEYVEGYGSLRIEYIILPKELCPSLIEPYLLQAYLNDKGRLPLENKEL